MELVVNKGNYVPLKPLLLAFFTNRSILFIETQCFPRPFLKGLKEGFKGVSFAENLGSPSPEHMYTQIIR